MDNYDWEDRGELRFIINAKEKELTLHLFIYRQKVNYESFTRNFDGLDEEMRKYVDDLSTEYKSGTIHYEGYGDSGFIEQNITFEDGMSENYPSFMEQYLYSLLDHFGGWEINEGSQGDIYFNFEEKQITIEHGENYEESEKLDFPTRYKF